MGFSKKLLSGITATVLLVICILIANAIAADMKPVKFKCDDGRIFSITFIKEKDEVAPMKARLVFSNSRAVEILVNDRAGSGIAYSNDKYSFNEHHDVVYLTDYTKSKKGNEIACHKIK